MRPSSATASAASPDVGGRIRSRREALGLSQRKAAEAVGVDRRAYQNWEKGLSGITWENLEKLADVLEASVDWLRLGDEGIDELVDSAQPRRGPRPVGTRVLEQLTEIRNAVVHGDPDTLILFDEAHHVGERSFLAAALVDIHARLVRIEELLDATVTDETRAAIDAARAVKEAASVSVGAGGQAKRPAESPRDAEGATPGAARAAAGRRPRAPR